jgi:hypothetical protein
MKSRKEKFPIDEDAGVLDSSNESGDLLWGVAEIAAELRGSRAQTYHLIRIGALDGCVRKLGHRTIAASRRKLKQLVAAE